MNSKKTDNGNLFAKLKLREYFLEKYGCSSVFDCCQGSGIIWGQLKKKYKTKYFGVDLKPKKGRIKIDSARLLNQTGWDYDVIDIDTYGEPWRQLNAVVNHMRHNVTVFLTIGHLQIGGGGLSKLEQKALGLDVLTKAPSSLLSKLHDVAVKYMLTKVVQSDIIIVEAVEAVSTGNARYIGIRLEKKNECNL